MMKSLEMMMVLLMKMKMKTKRVVFGEQKERKMMKPEWPEVKNGKGMKMKVRQRKVELKVVSRRMELRMPKKRKMWREKTTIQEARHSVRTRCHYRFQWVHLKAFQSREKNESKETVNPEKPQSKKCR
jgi:hypothetical protein